MKIGCCVGWDKANIVKKAGGDFLELPLSQIASFSEEEFRRLKNLSLPGEVFNILLPSGMKIVGPEVEWNKVREYLDKAFARAKKMGGEVIVFGSGGARRRPDDFPLEEAEEQLLRFLHLSGDIASSYDLRIAVEHLNSLETNMITTLREALSLVEKVGRDNIGVMVDLYHLLKEGEDMEEVRWAREHLLHIHIADEDRNPPSRKESIKRFLALLKEIGYDGRISIESKWEDMEQQLPCAFSILRTLWEG